MFSKSVVFFSVLSLLMAACGGGSASGNAEASGQASTQGSSEGPMAQNEDPKDVHIEGDHITIDTHILFAHNSDEIQHESDEILDHIAQLLKRHGEIKNLKVIGHTDADGGHDYNQTLSERRAAAVAKALTNRGVPQDLSASGVGELEPVCKEDTPECHESNRRVEFIINAPKADSGAGQ